MFENACQQFFHHHTILPIEIATRFESGKPHYGVGAGILINDDGWIITAGHILLDMRKTHEAITKANDHHKQVEEIRSDTALSAKERQKRLRTLGKLPPTTPRNQAVRIGLKPAAKWNERVFQLADVGILKVDNYEIPKGYVQPCFRTNPVDIGEMVCRAGYPFYEAGVDWDEQANQFVSKLESVPLFVNEGIISRFVIFKSASDKGSLENIKFIETSSPGLRGQSGGPLIDKEGRICGMQSHTHHYALDFAPQKGGQTEHQFLNVGRAVHVDTIRWCLDKFKIPYRTQ